MRNLFASSCIFLLFLFCHSQDPDQELADAVSDAGLTTLPPSAPEPAPPPTNGKVPNEDYLDEEDQEQLEKHLGSAIKARFIECHGNVIYCKVADYVKRLLKEVVFLDKHFRSYPRAGFRKTECEKYWQLVSLELQQLRNSCEADDDFPPVCQQLTLEVPDYIVNTQVFTLCSLIEPGEMNHRLPTCFDITTMMLREEKTLTQCPTQSKEQCLDYFCDFYSTFRHRIQPWNMLNEEGKKEGIHTEEFVLTGCEKVVETPFDRELCTSYIDINGFCDCLCPKLPDLTLPDLDDLDAPDTTWCDAPTDAYLLFGRIGVQDVKLDPKCEKPVCKLFDNIRLLPQCEYLQLPVKENCLSMQLPHVSFDKNACPWLYHSGEDNILVCNDGYRCNVQLEGWACCVNRHRGRGSCPRNWPQMCDIKCGNTEAEYCCDQPNNCRPLGCSPSLLPYPVYPTTTVAPTLDPARFKKQRSVQGAAWEPPPGFWVWFFIIIPLLGFLCFVRWWRKQRNKTYPDPLTIRSGRGKDDVHMTEAEDHSNQNTHSYLTIRASGRMTRMVKAGPTFIYVPHLLSDGSLGLELQETTVTHVKDEVKVFGWRYGDKVIEVNGYPVATFEALWARFLGGRNRLPIKFGILRKESYVHPSLPDEVTSAPTQPQFVNARPQRIPGDGEGDSNKKVAIDPLNERADFLRITSESQTDWGGTEAFQPDQTRDTFKSGSMAASSSQGGKFNRSWNETSSSGLKAQAHTTSSSNNRMLKQANDAHFDAAPVQHEKVEFVKDAYGRPVACSYPNPHRF